MIATIHLESRINLATGIRGTGVWHGARWSGVAAIEWRLSGQSDPRDDKGDNASESIQRSSRRPSRAISSGSRNVLVSSEIPW
jgi:hypothetical protein